MVDIEYLKHIKLVSIPLGQKLIGTFFLGLNYNIFAKVDIQIENAERIPRGENVIFAMNHTDRLITGLSSIRCGGCRICLGQRSGSKANITAMISWRKGWIGAT